MERLFFHNMAAWMYHVVMDITDVRKYSTLAFSLSSANEQPHGDEIYSSRDGTFNTDPHDKGYWFSQLFINPV